MGSPVFAVLSGYGESTILQIEVLQLQPCLLDRAHTTIVEQVACQQEVFVVAKQVLAYLPDDSRWNDLPPLLNEVALVACMA